MKEADSRQLLAIMFTDVVGYTSLTERDEAAAVRVREQHRDLVQTLVGQFDGEVVDVTGDESFSVFPSALRAVDCALALQGALRSYSDLRLRIGIHLGDVLRHGGEVVGEGVNVAARVRPLAEPGGIVVSEPVYQMVRTRAHVTGESLGLKNFKNVGEPLAVYALHSADDAGPTPARVSRAGRRSLRIGGLAAIAVVALLLLNRATLLAWIALNLPGVFTTPIEQEIGFATTTDGVRIAYATTGEGPPVVWVLGWATHIEGGIGSPLYDQSGVIALSSRKNLFVRYDGRGFGMSDRNVSDFSLGARLRDLEAVIDALKLEQFSLFGVSAGGPTAIAYAARHPDRVTRLALGSTQASFGWMSDKSRDRFTNMLVIFETDWDVPTVSYMMVDVLAPTADDVARRVLGEFLRRAGDGRAVAGFHRASFGVDVEEEARSISVPTLVLHARDDRAIELEAGRRLASLIPNARFEVVEGNHLDGTGGSAATRAQVMAFLNE